MTEKPTSAITKITFEFRDEDMIYFEALSKTASNSFTRVEDMLEYWISCLRDGIRRPGSWERGLLPSAFGDLDGLHDYLETNQWGQLEPIRKTQPK